MSKTIAVIAGENSGDTLAALIIDQLVQLLPSIRILAVGGDKVESLQRCELIAKASDLSVVGITEVVRKYPSLKRAFRQIKSRLLDEDIDHLITVDFPGFNLRLASAVADQKIPTTHVVSPQVWAWREGRVETIRHAISNLFVLFPFEVDYYQERGIEARTFGHPLLDDLDSSSSERELRAQEFKGNDSRQIVAWLPGSRVGELKRHLPIFSGAIERLGHARFRHVVSRVESLAQENYDIAGVEFTADTGVLLESASVAVVKSGTSTFEAMAIGTPQVVIYKVSWLTYLLGKQLAKISSMAMPNILANRTVVPELIQGELTPEKLEVSVNEILDQERSIQIRGDYQGILSGFQRGGTVKRIAAALAQEI